VKIQASVLFGIPAYRGVPIYRTMGVGTTPNATAKVSINRDLVVQPDATAKDPTVNIKESLKIVLVLVLVYFNNTYQY
jgi:hypothetical protein